MIGFINGSIHWFSRYHFIYILYLNAVIDYFREMSLIEGESFYLVFIIHIMLLRSRLKFKYRIFGYCIIQIAMLLYLFLARTIYSVFNPDKHDFLLTTIAVTVHVLVCFCDYSIYLSLTVMASNVSILSFIGLELGWRSVDIFTKVFQKFFTLFKYEVVEINPYAFAIIVTWVNLYSLLIACLYYLLHKNERYNGMEAHFSKYKFGFLSVSRLIKRYDYTVFVYLFLASFANYGRGLYVEQVDNKHNESETTNPYTDKNGCFTTSLLLFLAFAMGMIGPHLVKTKSKERKIYSVFAAIASFILVLCIPIFCKFTIKEDEKKESVF